MLPGSLKTTPPHIKDALTVNYYFVSLDVDDDDVKDVKVMIVVIVCDQSFTIVRDSLRR